MTDPAQHRPSGGGPPRADGGEAHVRPEPSDESLVERVQAGDVDAFDELIARYKSKLYSTIYHMTSNRDDALDLLQETFIRAFKAMPRFRANAKFSTWAYRIAVNVTINHLRERKHRTLMSLDDIQLGGAEWEELGEILRVNPDQEDPEEKLRNLQTILNRAIQSLSENHRAVVVLHDIDEKTHAQIAEILDVPEGTVKTRLFHAHRLLKKKLALYLKQDGA